jgi:hypothetical protein
MIKNGVFTPVVDSVSGKPLKAQISREDAIEILTKANPNFLSLDQTEQNRQINAVINLYNNTDTIVNENLKVDEEGGFNLGAAILDFLNIFN